MSEASVLRKLPSVDEVLRDAAATPLLARFGRHALTAAIRDALATARAEKSAKSAADVLVHAASALEELAAPKLRPVFNLTGTVLHTNLGRALLAEAAVEAAQTAMRNAVALEFDIGGGERGERDDIVRGLLCELTGAEDATLVNNNAAAVLLVLNTLAHGREAIVSRGELIEIGGAFRMPDIMARAGVKLVEVGTTNRTHHKDYAGALHADTGLILKVHTSNYRIEGFTKEVKAPELAVLAREHNVPLVNDLGSGTLVDLAQFGLTHEPTVREAVAEGADLVTFSGDKLLGGPQAGFIVGKKSLLAKINKNPMKRALRVDKLRIAALEATLKLYRHPETLAERLPTLRLLARKRPELEMLAKRILPAVSEKLGPGFEVSVVPCRSQIGSGALPLETIESAGIGIRLAASRAGKGAGKSITALSSAFRSLPVPVVGYIADQQLIFDLRCLEDEAAFLRNIASLQTGGIDALA